MVRAQDLVRMMRRRAGLSQGELAARAGMSRLSVVRYERGDREPAYADLARLAAAAELDLSASLATADSSLRPLVGDQLRLQPLERVRRMVRPSADGTERALATVADLARKHVIVGEVADVLHGSPQTTSGTVDLVLPAAAHATMPDRLLEIGAWPGEEAVPGRQTWELPDGGRLRLVLEPPGTRGYADLARDARRMRLSGVAGSGVPGPGVAGPGVAGPGVPGSGVPGSDAARTGVADQDRQREVVVASVVDLLRIAEASGDWARVRRPGLVALLEAGAMDPAAA